MRAVRVYNFSAGPAMIPLPVLERAQSELIDWQGSGMSVMEVSHRGKPFVACAGDAEQRMRSVFGVSDDYAVLFLQGGATGQFAAIPMNLTAPGDRIDLINTGAWSKKALAEAKRQELDVTVVADEKASNYRPGAGRRVVRREPGRRLPALHAQRDHRWRRILLCPGHGRPCRWSLTCRARS